MTAPTGDASARELRRLRLRITALITLLATVVVVVFAVVAIRLDEQLRLEQLDAELLAQTNLAAGAVGFVDGQLDFDAVDVAAIGDDVLIGVRPEFDVIEIAEGGLGWDSPPQMDADEYEQRVADVVDDLDPFIVAQLFGSDDEAPGLVAGWRQQLKDDPTDDVEDQAYRDFLFDEAEREGIELVMPTELLRAPENPLDERAAFDAVAEVADEGNTERFAIDESSFVARGVRLRTGAEVRGAIVTIADLTPTEEDHAVFRRSIVGIGALLVVFAALASWFVAGRTIRPAARALAQQERFLADAAHELRTPIAAIRATADAGRRTGSAEALGRVSELAAGAGQLTDDLLTLARMDADRLTLQKEPVRLDLLVEAVIDGDPAFVMTLDEVVVEADPGLAERAVGNLLRNAVLHGGATAANPAAVTVSSDGVRVHDRGPGVPDELATQLFERFRSGTASTGHGLGLPLTRWIARAHGGDCELDTSALDGAAFDLRFGPPRA